MCDDDDASCRMGCSARAKRSADSRRQKSHLVSTGPLFIEKRGNESKGKSLCKSHGKTIYGINIR